MPAAVRLPARSTQRSVLRAAGFVLAWAVVAVPVWMLVFFHSQAPLVVASHDATVSPTLDRHSRIEMGPYLPDFRIRNDQLVGVDVVLGKTDARSTSELVRRYALLAGRPEPEERRIREEVIGLAWDAVPVAVFAGLVPIGLWLLLGRRRRADLARPTVLRAAAVTGAFGLVLLVVLQPWRPDADRVQTSTWLPLPQAIPEIQVPPELAHVEVQGGLLTATTRKFISSGFDSYRRSVEFFKGIEDKAPTIADLLHRPGPDEITAVLVSDRHDNISMDAVVRRVADLAGATVIIDAGDDTSSGQPWEAFSLDSLDDAFKDYDARIAIAGNHDNGSFVSRYLEKSGWTHLEATTPVKPFGDVRFFGVDDPRSSGLGSWIDEKGLSYGEVEQRMADTLCQLDSEGKRVATVVVHAASLARPALDRGCVDLVLAGHLHRQVGPTRVVGENGKVGYTYTNGTTGGAAYAIAIASKLRREAEFTLVTYADGRPVGIQPVRITPAGEYVVEPYTTFDWTAPVSTSLP